MKCANPLCDREERYFRSGTLHAIDCDLSEQRVNGQATRKKVVWLCDGCSRNFRVQTWRPPGEQIHACSTKRASVRAVHKDLEEITSAA